MIHDCVYQFLRLFYHSRYKPPQLQMTMSQLSTPIIDLVLVLPLILRLAKDFSIFSNKKKNDLMAKFLFFSPAYLSSIAVLPSLSEVSRSHRLAIIYRAKAGFQFLVIISGLKRILVDFEWFFWPADINRTVSDVILSILLIDDGKSVLNNNVLKNI